MYFRKPKASQPTEAKPDPGPEAAPVKAAQATGSTVPQLANGVLAVGTARFRELCAVTAEGQAYIAEGYRYNDSLMDELAKLQRTGQLPRVEHYNSVPLPEIAQLHSDEVGPAHLGGRAVTEADAAAKLSRAMIEAARAGASDLKIYERSHDTIVRVKVAGREYNLGTPWTTTEGWVAMNYLFNQRDEGGQHTSMAKTQFQSFSVSAGGDYHLPPGIIKLRGQKGFHENDRGLGTHMVLRLFQNEASSLTGTLEDLGFDDEVYEALQRARDRLSGAVIIGGATGDGKSTTLIRTMDKLDEEYEGALSIVTVEDPVEYRAKGDGIVQIPVGSAGDAKDRQANYRRALMHFVRINPDVGCISEIRDADGAKEILQFVASGHASYTTIHTESAGETVFRLIDMGVPAQELAKPGGIRLLMKQTLVPTLCPHCSRPAETVEDLPRPARHLPLGKVRRRNPEGCPTCLQGRSGLGARAWAGYQRLIAVAEVIEPDEGWFRHVLSRDAFGARAHWLKPVSEGGLGGTPIGAKVARLVLDGRLDPFDAVSKQADFEAGEITKLKVVGERE